MGFICFQNINRPLGLNCKHTVIMISYTPHMSSSAKSIKYLAVLIPRLRNQLLNM
jgi:hypothetical protein